MVVTSKNEFSPPARILLVDDDSTFRQEFIETFDEFTIAEASAGDEAIQILKKPNELDLVILDVRMSGMNGIEVLDKIKRIIPGIHVVIFTGYGSKDIAVEALRSRADDYLEKPIDIKATRQIIEKHLGDKERHDYGSGIEDKIRHAKDFLLSNFHKKVTLEDVAKAVYLSPKYLSRLFREHVKTGFNEYKLSLRMGQAKNLLEKTGFTVGQISDRLGYQNPESFIRQFKKISKSTPTEFRNKIHKKKFRNGRKNDKN
jgi:YesN/AraC family two-component response regulator